MTDRDVLAEALFDALGWSGSFRYHPKDAKVTDDYSTYRRIPDGIVSGDIDHDDWRAFVDRVRAALAAEPAGLDAAWAEAEAGLGRRIVREAGAPVERRRESCGVMVTIVPLTLKEARRFVAEHHRHNEPPIGHRFSIGLRRDGDLIGVVVAGHPVARNADDGLTIELVRLTTTGDRNACSRLYGAACRAAAAMGYLKAITYTLADEPGSSLLASGFQKDGTTEGHEGWKHGDGALNVAFRPRLFDPPLMPTGPKTKWIRDLA